ncbi:hypothetical protein ANO11243_092380 [Dothideomycetidae sp. 11243]|nr:hypothetical protein ANO11243_092380 [fungal sp. No.11243]
MRIGNGDLSSPPCRNLNSKNSWQVSITGTQAKQNPQGDSQYPVNALGPPEIRRHILEYVAFDPCSHVPASQVCREWRLELQAIRELDTERQLSSFATLPGQSLEKLAQRTRHLAYEGGGIRLERLVRLQSSEGAWFPNLCSLRLDGYDPVRPQLPPGFVYRLLGPKLKALILVHKHWSEIPWAAWAASCPVLEELTVEHFSQRVCSRPYLDDDFADYLAQHRRITSIKIETISDFLVSATPAVLAQVAGHTNLRVLHLARLEDDTIWHELRADIEHPFCFLEELVLTSDCETMKWVVRSASRSLRRLDFTLIDHDGNILREISELTRLTYLRISTERHRQIISDALLLVPLVHLTPLANLKCLQCLRVEIADRLPGRNRDPPELVPTLWDPLHQEQFLSSFSSLEHLVLRAAETITMSAFLALGRTTPALRYCNITVDLDFAVLGASDVPMFARLEHLQVSQLLLPDQEIHNTPSEVVRSRMPSLDSLIVSRPTDRVKQILELLRVGLEYLDGRKWEHCELFNNFSPGSEHGIAVRIRTNWIWARRERSVVSYRDSPAHGKHNFLASSDYIPVRGKAKDYTHWFEHCPSSVLQLRQVETDDD